MIKIKSLSDTQEIVTLLKYGKIIKVEKNIVIKIWNGYFTFQSLYNNLIERTYGIFEIEKIIWKNRKKINKNN